MKGIGVDIVSISQFKDLVNDRSAPFMEKNFTSDEIAYAFNAISDRPEQHIAVRYAAKEAVIKALEQARGNLFDPLGSISYRDIEVVIDDVGRPYVDLKSDVKKYAKDLGVKDIKVSLSHDDDYAIAQVYMG